jgi:transcriptional regulator with XRE-family HTH domain
MDIGKNIRKNRSKLKLSRKKISEITGVSEGYIGEIERGEKVPSIETLLKISRPLKLTVSQLIGEINILDDYLVDLQKIAVKKPEEIKRLVSLLKLLSNDEIRAISNFVEAFKK